MTALGSERVELVLPVRPDSIARLPDLPPSARVLETRDLFAEGADWWRDALQGVDVVVHSAWVTTHTSYLNAEENIDLLAGSIRLAQHALNSNVRRFVGLGTCLEYAPSEGPLETSSAIDPKSLYASAKASLFFVLRALFSEKEADLVWCRLFYLFGEGQDPNRLHPYSRSRLSAGLPLELQNGDQVLDYLDVRDAADAIVKVALADKPLSGTFNVCSGVGRSVRHIVEQIAEAYGNEDLLSFVQPTGAGDHPGDIVGVPSWPIRQPE